MKFTKKPVTIDAVQITPRMVYGYSSLPDGVRFINEDEVNDSSGRVPALLSVDTIEGTPCHGHIGDWLITGVRGEKYFCQDKIFRSTYSEGVAEYPIIEGMKALDLKGKVLVVESSNNALNMDRLIELVPSIERCGAIGVIQVPGDGMDAVRSEDPDYLAPVIIQLMGGMSSDESRAEFMGALHAAFCGSCGRKTNGKDCRCWDDE